MNPTTAVPLRWATPWVPRVPAWHLTALRQLERTGGRRALATMCIGVGQGIALALERA